MNFVEEVVNLVFSWFLVGDEIFSSALLTIDS